MKGYIGRRIRALRRGESGFTLVELLVVVGIIVALAAVIIPNVASFANRGETGALAAENDNVQAAMDTMMADKTITSVTDLVSPANSNQVWTALPTGTGADSLFGATIDYLRSATTTYFYCWDTSGLITQQDLAAATCP